jgi:hypothetical protein
MLARLLSKSNDTKKEVPKEDLEEAVIIDNHIINPEKKEKPEDESEKGYFLKKWEELLKREITIISTERIRPYSRYSSICDSLDGTYDITFTNPTLGYNKYIGEIRDKQFHGIGKLISETGNYMLGRFEEGNFIEGEQKNEDVIFRGEFQGNLINHEMSKGTYSIEKQKYIIENISGEISKGEEDDYAIIKLPNAEIQCKLKLTQNGINIAKFTSIKFSNGCFITGLEKFKVPLDFRKPHKIVMIRLNGTFNFPKKFNLVDFDVMSYKYFLLTTFPYFSTEFFSNYTRYPLTQDMILNTMVESDWIDLGLNNFQMKLLAKKSIELINRGVIN